MVLVACSSIAVILAAIFNACEWQGMHEMKAAPVGVCVFDRSGYAAIGAVFPIAQLC